MCYYLCGEAGSPRPLKVVGSVCILHESCMLTGS